MDVPKGSIHILRQQNFGNFLTHPPSPFSDVWSLMKFRFWNLSSILFDKALSNWMFFPLFSYAVDRLEKIIIFYVFVMNHRNLSDVWYQFRRAIFVIDFFISKIMSTNCDFFFKAIYWDRKCTKNKSNFSVEYWLH